MVTYTRCLDSILCVPLMVDAAIWCDYFVQHDVSSSDAARATAYLFKVPEGDAKGIDPGFFYQMRELENVLKSGANEDDVITMGLRKGIISKEQANALRSLSNSK